MRLEAPLVGPAGSPCGQPEDRHPWGPRKGLGEYFAWKMLVLSNADSPERGRWQAQLFWEMSLNFQ